MVTLQQQGRGKTSEEKSTTGKEDKVTEVAADDVAQDSLATTSTKQLSLGARLDQLTAPDPEQKKSIMDLKNIKSFFGLGEFVLKLIDGRRAGSIAALLERVSKVDDVFSRELNTLATGINEKGTALGQESPLVGLLKSIQKQAGEKIEEVSVATGRLRESLGLPENFSSLDRKGRRKILHDAIARMDKREVDKLKNDLENAVKAAKSPLLLLNRFIEPVEGLVEKVNEAEKQLAKASPATLDNIANAKKTAGEAIKDGVGEVAKLVDKGADIETVTRRFEKLLTGVEKQFELAFAVEKEKVTKLELEAEKKRLLDLQLQLVESHIIRIEELKKQLNPLKERSDLRAGTTVRSLPWGLGKDLRKKLDNEIAPEFLKECKELLEQVQESRNPEHIDKLTQNIEMLKHGSEKMQTLVSGVIDGWSKFHGGFFIFEQDEQLKAAPSIESEFQKGAMSALVSKWGLKSADVEEYYDKASELFAMKVGHRVNSGKYNPNTEDLAGTVYKDFQKTFKWEELQEALKDVNAGTDAESVFANFMGRLDTELKQARESSQKKRKNQNGNKSGNSGKDTKQQE